MIAIQFIVRTLMSTALTILLMLAMTAPFAQAGTYKCVTNGQTIYADQPCAVNARNVDALQDRLTQEQRVQRLEQSIKERTQRNSIERRENAEFNARQRAMEIQVANEAAQEAARESTRRNKCAEIESDMKHNQRAVARYQQFGWQQSLTQRENELKQNRESHDKNCR